MAQKLLLDEYEELREKLREGRLLREYSAEKIALLLGISRRSVIRFEEGECKRLSADHLDRVRRIVAFWEDEERRYREGRLRGGIDLRLLLRDNKTVMDDDLNFNDVPGQFAFVN